MPFPSVQDVQNHNFPGSSPLDLAGSVEVDGLGVGGACVGGRKRKLRAQQTPHMITEGDSSLYL